jgi:lysylphosphatidylglycerol synthetase-like protein (DUF2156 family)
MRVLGSTVLITEAIIVMLAALVAAGTGAVDSMGTSLAIGGALALLLIAAVGTMGRPYGVIVGWVLQGFVLAWGFWVPSMWVVGGIFAILWFLAVRNGARVDALRAQRAAEEEEPGG